MRIRIDMTIEVDPEAWSLEYGVTYVEIRDDVRTWFRTAAETGSTVPMPIIRG